MVRCKVCGGNDGDMPCAYPSKGMVGCLRDKRLSEPDEEILVIGKTGVELTIARQADGKFHVTGYKRD